MGRSLDREIEALASLDQPVRRELFDLLASRGWTSRDDAAALLGIARSVVAFHLDKLADVGVVEVTFERTTGRSGPGAGRPSKLYRLADEELSASVPERHYELAGRVLADAVAASAASGGPVIDCLQEVARTHGLAAAHRERGDRDDVAGPPPDADDLLGALERLGYEPVVADEAVITLENCPFHRLAESQRDLVCGMNLEFVRGLIEGLAPDPSVGASLEPEAGRCCVRLRGSAAPAAAS